MFTATDLAYASQGGTATWLWWYSYDSNNINGNLKYQAIFSVGTIGSGSDFELPSTTIVNGSGYKLVNGPKLSLATSFTY
jgi:hypothetical protein